LVPVLWQANYLLWTEAFNASLNQLSED
jgi:hypothetical protein